MLETEKRDLINNLYEEHGQMLLNLCNKYINNQCDAEDIFQDAMIKIYNNLHRYDNEGSFKSWVYTIFVNSAISAYRKKYKKIVLPIVEEIVEEPNGFHENEPDLNAEELQMVIDKLPSQYQRIFHLYSQGYKYEEMAEILKLNINTCKSLLFRTKRWLRKRIMKINR